MKSRHNHRCTHKQDTTQESQETFSLILSETELYFISDAVSLKLPSFYRSLSTIKTSEKLVPGPLDLIEEVGTAIAEIVATGNKTAQLDITFFHAMILREIADTRIYINKKAVGLTLKRKLYSLIFSDLYEEKVKTKKLMKGINNNNN